MVSSKKSIGMKAFVEISGEYSRMCSMWVLNPDRQWLEPWRFIMYGLVHNTLSHLIQNVLGLVMVGMTLEYYHSSWRVMVIYITGIIFGGLGRINPVISKLPPTPLAGSSGMNINLLLIKNKSSARKFSTNYITFGVW